MKITRHNDKLSRYRVAVDSDKLKELGYGYNTAHAQWIKRLNYNEVFDSTGDFDDSHLYLEIKTNGDLAIRYNWELYSAEDGENYGGFMEVSIIDEVLALNEAGLLIKR